MSLFIPDIMFESVFDISPSFLSERGIKAAILDIDNTLVTYGEEKPGEEVSAWIRSLSSAGISPVIASNNGKERVDLFNSGLGITALSKCRKPSRAAVRLTCASLGIKADSCAVIGDQIFTDVLCARRAGAYAILVTPLKYKENLFFKFKRLMEKPFIAEYRRRKRGEVK